MQLQFEGCDPVNAELDTTKKSVDFTGLCDLADTFLDIAHATGIKVWPHDKVVYVGDVFNTPKEAKMPDYFITFQVNDAVKSQIQGVTYTNNLDSLTNYDSFGTPPEVVFAFLEQIRIGLNALEVTLHHDPDNPDDSFTRVYMRI